MKAQAIYNVPRSILGEGPVWDDRLNALYWVDIIGGKVHGLKDNRVDTVFQINDFVTCVALTSNPNYLLVTLKDRVVLVDVNARSIVKTLAKLMSRPPIDLTIVRLMQPVDFGLAVWI